MRTAVYQRDCSWFSCAGGGSGGKYHFPGGRNGASKCGKALMLQMEGSSPARVDPRLRCKAKGCAELWNAAALEKPE